MVVKEIREQPIPIQTCSLGLARHHTFELNTGKADVFSGHSALAKFPGSLQVIKVSFQ